MDDDGVVCQFELLDSEMIAAQKVVEKIERVKHQLALEDFDKMAVDEFAKINIEATVAFRPKDTVFLPRITLHRRIIGEQGFDHERQTWEVQHSILGVDEPGKLQPDGTLKSLPQSTGFVTKKD